VGTVHYARRLPPLVLTDRTLQHLHIVITAKLRLRQPFFLMMPTPDGISRVAVWIDTSIPLSFSYDTSESVPLNRAWLADMLEHSNETTAVLTSEP
jgi:hypothetical protein